MTDSEESHLNLVISVSQKLQLNKKESNIIIYKRKWCMQHPTSVHLKSEEKLQA